jgi:hypothetical protein
MDTTSLELNWTETGSLATSGVSPICSASPLNSAAPRKLSVVNPRVPVRLHARKISFD